ncbi:unnamed protein product [Brachionus calyciflorus]|uniref:Amine oxidase domain-containing protein n=1 Tax=Brachionus calyciflorus TaxID=104777 RepID=A0A813XTH5_9BILA|nr:unnamed protein product [Brachionus calyciflorus]
MDSDSDNSIGEHVCAIKTDIVIIGAGCAGLECAAKLYSFGFENLVVLEAQDYIGGRIKTTLINEDETLPLEIGANWIHGYLGNPIYRLVIENPDLFVHKKKKLFDIFTDQIYCADENGKYYAPSFYESLWEKYNIWNLEAKALWVKSVKSEFTTYTEFMINKLEQLMDEENLSEYERKIKLAIMNRFLKQETAESGCATMDLLSVNEYGSYLKPFGPDYEFPGGFSGLIQFLADKIPKNSIKLNHAVEQITMFDDEETPMLVQCKNGTSYRAKHVLVTTSVNYLKKHYQSLFNPSLLTTKKIEAIQTVKMDTVDKIFLFYEDMSFFPENCDAVHPIFTNQPENVCMKTDWKYKVYTFDKFYDNMLLVWITGKEAEYVETLDNEEIGDTLTDLLRKVLNNKNIPKPDRVFKTQWKMNPYVLGSYSYVDVNGQANKHINDLAEPLYINNVPRVLFAGEATHLRYYSTVHGAYLSGQREATRLFEFYSSKK